MAFFSAAKCLLRQIRKAAELVGVPGLLENNTISVGWFHSYRVARCYRHYRNPRESPSGSAVPGESQSAEHSMHQQSSPDHAQFCYFDRRRFWTALAGVSERVG